MASDPPKEVLDRLEALRARSVLHASSKDAGSLRTRFGIAGSDRKPDEAAATPSSVAFALAPQP